MRSLLPLPSALLPLLLACSTSLQEGALSDRGTASDAPAKDAGLPDGDYHRTGRSELGGIAVPSVPGGGELLGPDCTAVNERLRGKGPPCAVETWAGEGKVWTLFRAGNAARFEGPEGEVVRARAHWSVLAGTLSRCMPDPLALPPAGDPGGDRGFDGDDWVLVFTGQNRCRLEGTLRFAADADRADFDQLAVNGTPWTRGGRDLADRLLADPLFFGPDGGRTAAPKAGAPEAPAQPAATAENGEPGAAEAPLTGAEPSPGGP